jgi:hypothetical protein
MYELYAQLLLTSIPFLFYLKASNVLFHKDILS